MIISPYHYAAGIIICFSSNYPYKIGRGKFDTGATVPSKKKILFFAQRRDRNGASALEIFSEHVIFNGVCILMLV